MDIETLWKYGVGLPEASSRSPFGPDTLALEVGGKMFALFTLAGEHDFYNVKVDEARGEELRERYASVHPGYHMNKRTWVSVDFCGDLPEGAHCPLLLHGYRQVLRGMSRRQRKALTRLDIRPTAEADIPAVLSIFDKAKLYMRRQGNHEQWTGAYPDAEAVRADMARGWSYVVEQCGEVVGTFCMMTEPEPTYATLPSAAHYATLHRVASSGEVAGVVEAAFDYALAAAGRVRIDTHPTNAAMLAAIKRLRMKPLGAITLADGTPRQVFER